MKPVKWGIISTANIGVAKVIPGMLKSGELEVVAISSRNEKTAKEWARKLGIPKAYGSYEAMLADPEIEAVYNPLPNHLHVPLTLAAAEAGKHVLCEKPIGLSSAEGQRLVDAAARFPRLKVMEAFMYRHHPQWQRARQIVLTGAGDILEAGAAAVQERVRDQHPAARQRPEQEHGQNQGRQRRRQQHHRAADPQAAEERHRQEESGQGHRFA
jgi:predicted dehydrogenase